MIRLINHHDLEALPRARIQLLSLRHFLQQVLHDNAVVVPDVRGRDLEVVDGGYDVELELSVAGGLEDARVDLYLLDAGAVEFLERGDNAGFFAGA